ncbi:DUF349 domain-containing protein [Aquabacterium sp.]|uniref:DUF349 domain-containing protein n=1 Tax=Aquabacterium sp. TaxID=1872578 RepID=UPI0019A7B6ED|nr:DUF349 domain-containing protein [Aquabacterium sp.]MBC7702077.1 DUF349 domain-containing protein [Aquabacterium sp.]
MLSWIFRKKKASPPVIAARPAASAQATSAARQAAANVASVWSGRLDRALGDDAALLALAKEAPTADLKLAAVQALSTEAGLKSAEREFRTHDRRVHQLARQRHAHAKAKREVAERATALISAAAVLLDVPVIPVNRLVEFDRGWQALDASLLSAAHQAEYAALSGQLSAAMQAHGDQQAAALAAAAEAAAAAAALAQTQALEAHELAQEALTRLADSPSAEPENAPEYPPEYPITPPSRQAPKVPTAEHSAAIEVTLLQAEAALLEGLLKQVQQHLMQLDRMSGHGMDTAHRARLNAVQAEAGRMKGWQQWSGGLARDDLVLEAEALAKATAAAAAAEAATEADEPKLPARAQAEAIDDLRQRWKELDRLAAATSQPLWERFDAALQTAYLPVAAHLAQLEADRQANLAWRGGLLDTLDATPLACGTDADAAFSPWKDLVRALDQFHQAWRKLGPVEHTVPRKAHKALQARLTTSVARLEAPLQAARRVAQAEREALVSRAKALTAEGRLHPAEQLSQVRELQAEWQAHARALPLARPIEAALWDQFKAATDAVFAQRDAAFSARDDALQANLAERLSVIERLEAITPDSPAADVNQALRQLDAAWRQAGEAPRAQAAALESRFRAARAGAQAIVADSAQRVWQATCDTLHAKLMLCEALESDEALAEAPADLGDRWAALPVLPPLWEQALAQRQARIATGDGAPSRADLWADERTVDEALLQLEAALDLPSPPEHQASRRDLKLRALKAALEGGVRLAGEAPGVDQMTAQVIGFSRLNAPQRLRLHSLIVGLRTVNPPVSSSPSVR